MQSFPQEIKNNIETVSQQIKKLKPEHINLFRAKAEEVPANVSINFFPDPEELHNVVKLIKKIEKIDSDLFFMNTEKLHVTLLGMIDINVIQEVGLLDEVIALLKSTPINFWMIGTNSNENCASVTCHPTGFDISILRNQLRSILGIEGDEYKRFLSVYDKLGWMNFIRYPKQPKVEVLDELRANIYTDFGKITKGEIRILINTSRVFRDGRIEIIKTAKL